jgi:EGF domain-specific O-GlcNAc transferase
MIIPRPTRSYRGIVFVAAVSILGLVYLAQFGTDYSLPSLHRAFNSPTTVQETETFSLPDEYDSVSLPAQAECDATHGKSYITRLSESRRPYCVAQSSESTLDCFHTNPSGDRNDVFCVARGVKRVGSFGSSDSLPHPFRVDCKLRDFGSETDLRNSPQVGSFPTYMYATGPRHVVAEYIDVGKGSGRGSGAAAPESCPSGGTARGYKMLIKREGETNIWHTLLEIFSFYLTLDVLQITPDPADPTQSLYSPEIAAHSQVVLLDQRGEGPFYELWNLFTGRPTIKFAELPPDLCDVDLVLPLPGGANTLWLDDWNPKPCTFSPLATVFSNRILRHYNIPIEPQTSEPIVVTVIDRKSSRVLKGLDSYVQTLRSRFDGQGPSVTIRAVDFAGMSFAEQLKIVRKTDVLVGVHGAGMTHVLFLPPGSAAVEIFPPELVYPVYRNLAKLMGMHYFSAHARKPGEGKKPAAHSQRDTSPSVYKSEEISERLAERPTLKQRLKRDWHGQDIEMDEEQFVTLVEIAVKSMYNRGDLNLDAVL